MRVRIDAEDAAELQGSAVPAPVQIEAPRVGIDLDGDAVRRAGDEHLFHIHLIAFAVAKKPPGHVPEDGGEWIGSRAYEALRLRLLVHPKLPMDAGDDKVEAAEHFVRVVQRAVR